MEPMLLEIHLPFSYWQERRACGMPLLRPQAQTVSGYARALCMEIESLGEDLADYRVEAIAFCGGYMSLFDAEEFGEIMAAVHRAFSVSPDVQVSGMLFPGSLDMALIAAYKNRRVGTLMFEIPSLSARECERLGLPNALQAMDQTLYLMQNFGVEGFGMRLPVGIAGRDAGAWQYILGQIRHYQPMHVEFWDISGGSVQEDAGFAQVKAALAAHGFAEIAPNFMSLAKTPLRFAAPGNLAVAGVGLGAVSRLDGFETRNTADLREYMMRCADYRQLIVHAVEIK